MSVVDEKGLAEMCVIQYCLVMMSIKIFLMGSFILPAFNVAFNRIKYIWILLQVQS